MTITLELKNLSAKPIALTTADTSITIDGGKTAAVPLDVVRGAAFAEHLAAGELALSRAGLDALDPGARAAALEAVGDVILRVAPRFVAHHATLRAALASLEALRDRYNALHATAGKLLADARALAAGAETVVAAIELSDGAADAAVDAAEAARRAHLQALPKTPDELAAWYAEHRRLEAALAAANAAQAAARDAVARQLDATRADLVAAAAAFGRADPARDIGPQLTWGA